MANEDRAMFPLYRHYKGNKYLHITTVTHSETHEAHVVYRSLYDNPVSRSWARPEGMFREHMPDGTPRFTPIGGVRVAMAQDEEELLLFGYDTWGKGLSREGFLANSRASRNHQRGVRYVLQDLNGRALSKVGVLRFARQAVGLYSIATRPDMRRRGHASLLVRAVMELLRLEEPETRFLLFSEVDPAMYERQGFQVLPESLQRFRPSLAMATGEAALSESEASFLQEYF